MTVARLLLVVCGAAFGTFVIAGTLLSVAGLVVVARWVAG